MLLSPTARAAVTFIAPFDNVQTIASTVPKNGDVNPYGVAVCPGEQRSAHGRRLQVGC
jgi:hypothetical protein